jgi:hypothetical protein
LRLRFRRAQCRFLIPALPQRLAKLQTLSLKFIGGVIVTGAGIITATGIAVIGE